MLGFLKKNRKNTFQFVIAEVKLHCPLVVTGWQTFYESAITGRHGGAQEPSGRILKLAQQTYYLFARNFPPHLGLQKGCAAHLETRFYPWFYISACNSKKEVQEVKDSIPVLWPKKDSSAIRAWEGCDHKQIF